MTSLSHALRPQTRPRPAGGGATRAFTLMEMILVLAIIALLIGGGVYMMTGILEDAKAQRADTDIKSHKTNLIRYQIQANRLPTTEQGLMALIRKPTRSPVPKRWAKIVSDERGLTDPWDNPYQYRNPGRKNTNGYDLFSMGPDGQPDTADDIGNWSDEAQ